MIPKLMRPDLLIWANAIPSVISRKHQHLTFQISIM